ncbi:hypothetical protein [Novipirellula sp.]|uniref:hypothetical protein n=1 Tax=Novipirellula sp. TaxID=2795430 RepID=UPI00356AE27D
MRVAILTLIALFISAEAVADDLTEVSEATLRFTYVVKASPVWTADGTFDPSVLIKLIEATTEQKLLRVHQLPRSGALSITTTIAGHQQIWKLLKQFPSIAAAWGPGDPDYPKLLREEKQQVERSQQMRRLSERMDRNRLEALRKRNSFDGITNPLKGSP